MKVKFNKFERVAGIFVLSTIIGGFAMLVGVAIKQGWFEAKIKFQTLLKNAEGVRVGTPVQMSGLRAGSVTGVELRSNNEIHVYFEISEKYTDLIREDSIVRAIRPFVISDKVVDVSIGNMQNPKAIAGSELRSEPTTDLMDLVSGRSLSPQFEAMAKMMDNLRVVAEAILDPNRSRDIIKIFDELAPLVRNMSQMSREVAGLLRDANKDKQLVRMVNSLMFMTEHVNKIVPEIAKLAPALSKDAPKLADDLSKIASNVAVLTDEIQGTLPALKQALKDIGPEVPRATRRAMEALDETVVTLKALQKSFLLRGNAREVRDEEAERERVRTPASSPSVPLEQK